MSQSADAPATTLASPAAARLVAVDWGTSRFRATLLGEAGVALGHLEADDGMARVAAGEFAAVLQRHCGPWLGANPALPVLMAGMVGSRNGWVEAPYAPAPASAADLAAAMVAAPRADGGSALIVPGVCGSFDGAGEVMRGEETIIMGLDLEDGTVCQPGTHSKWVEVRGGRIERFSTYMTGELFATALDHTILGRLAEGEHHSAFGFARGLEAVRSARALTNLLFQARADVLLARMAPEAVRSFISGLLIGHEVADATRRYPDSGQVHLIATAGQAARYEEAMAFFGVRPHVHDTDTVFLRGLARIAGLRR